jgi:hypothetical protein
MTPTTPPAYFQNSDIRSLFHWLLDRLDHLPRDQRTNALTRSVSAKNFPVLFRPEAPDDDMVLWGLLQRCARDGLIRIDATRTRRDPHLPPWAHRRIIFRLEHEDNLRLWLNRPEYTEAGSWWAALDKWGHAFQRADLVAKPVLMLPGKSPEEILSRLAVIPELVRERPLSAYQISARLFWGHSKVLKGREQWLRDLLGLPREAVVERMLPVEVTFPPGTPAGILMIENLDSYFSACNGNWQDCLDMIKIYTQGFRGAADRIRDPSCVRLHFADQPLPEGHHLAAFREAWFLEAAFTGPVYFCGDLDWSGLAIFRSLKAVFPDLTPWKPGYERMLRAAEQGCCHTLEMADKTGQPPLDTSGDLWLDSHVLSFLKAKQSFVDQEILG